MVLETKMALWMTELDFFTKIFPLPVNTRKMGQNWAKNFPSNLFEKLVFNFNDFVF